MDGIAASSSVRNMSGCRSAAGHSSEMNTAMPSAIGVTMSSARTEEYSVPQMNGSAPNSPATGSHISVRQKASPNRWMDSSDWRTSSKPIADTISTSASANTPVPARKPRSRERSVTTP